MTRNSTTKSIFAEGTYYVSDKLTIKAGVRFSDDEKDVKSIQGMSSSATPGGLGRENFTLAPPVLGVFNALAGRKPFITSRVQSRSENHTTPSLKVLYDFSDTTRLILELCRRLQNGWFRWI